MNVYIFMYHICIRLYMYIYMYIYRVQGRTLRWRAMRVTAVSASGRSYTRIAARSPCTRIRVSDFGFRISGLGRESKSSVALVCAGCV